MMKKIIYTCSICLLMISGVGCTVGKNSPHIKVSGSDINMIMMLRL